MTGTAERVFLGWDGPLLPRAATWLVERFGRDLSAVTVAVTGRRAGRRLVEHLALLDGPPVVPPHITTAGRLSDALLRRTAPSASRLARSLLWARALADHHDAAPTELTPLVAAPPSAEDSVAWVSLAEPLRALHGELGGACLDFADVLPALDERQARHERPRWQVLVALQARYRALLAGTGWVDPHDARRAALAEGDVVASGPVVLVGLSEASTLLRRTLHALPEPPVALVYAPPGEQQGFDALGCVDVLSWVRREIPLEDAQWSVVDRPLDQARRVVDVLRQWQGRFAAAQITVGLPDEEVGPYVARQLAAHGLTARPATGRPWSRTSVGRLLAATADVLRGHGFGALAALARHERIEAALLRPDDTAAGSRPLPERLDRHHVEHLPRHADEPGLLAPGWRGLRGLLGKLTQPGRRPLPAWCDDIDAYLTRMHDGVTVERESAADAELVGALASVRSALDELAALPEPAAVSVDAADALDLLARGLAGAGVAPAADDDAIEMLGWLELPFDDAPALIVTGFQEGRVPASRRAHPFLPDVLRVQLGLPADDQRVARDVHALTVLLASREELHLICGRRSKVNDPLHPSRLLFHGPDEQLTGRVGRVVLGSQGARPATRATVPATVVATARELPRHPHPPALERLSVTAFGGFLRSPYAVYLQRLLRLETVDDQARELDGRSFGTLAHTVLERFGKDATAAASTSAEQIGARLGELLDACVEEQFGRRPRPAVVLQVERLRRRLARFARWQAERTAAGWRILAAEWAPEGGSVPFEVDGEVLALSGKIDRVDQHSDGSWAILDYKTGDRGSTPSRTHGPVDDRWKDLQLPLYRLLVAPLAAEHGLSGEPALGYVNLSKDPEAELLSAANWTTDQLAAALESARDVVRAIRRGDWFERGDFPKFDPIAAAIAGLGLQGSDEDDEEVAAAEGAS